MLRGAAAGAILAMTGAGCGGGGGEESGAVCVVEQVPSTTSPPVSGISLNPVPTSVSLSRPTYMSRDEAGFIWATSPDRVLTRFDPSLGQITAIPHPFNAVVGHSVALSQKVYMLGLGYPNLMIYHRASGTFSEVPYPVANADVWYAAEEIHGPIDGRHMYLFNRSSPAVIKWDTLTDTGTVIPYPYNSPAPYVGRYIPTDGAIWCNSWDFSGGQYRPVGIARLNLATDQFDEFHLFPSDGTSLAPYIDPDPTLTLFYQRSFDGKLMPFDVPNRRFCRYIDTLGYKQLYSWIGMSSVHDGRWYFVLATLNVQGTGFDCKPYHFLNALLEFDPATGQFAVATLQMPNAYYQTSYILSVDNELYCMCNDILENDGSLNVGRIGQVLYWQSV